jgi:hypothetical protein
MEKDCESLFAQITALNNKKKQLDPTYHELQIWCADMWALLWGGWLRGYDTIILDELDFCWATDNLEKYAQKYIYHNAGVTDQMAHKFFYKANFRNKLPYEDFPEDYVKESASYKYFELIKSIGKNSCLYE